MNFGLKDDKKLILFTSHKEEVYTPLVKEFEERTGIWVQVQEGSTSELMEKIKAGRGKGEFVCDVMFGGGLETYNAYKDYLAPEIEFFTLLPVVIIYNNKMVSKEEAPLSWAALLNEHWRGNISFADPEKSGSSYTMLATLIQILNMEENLSDARSVLEAFARALNYRVAPGSGEVVDEVCSGAKAIGLTLEETALKAIARGEDISIVYPEDGTSAVPDACARVKWCRHPKNALCFLEFIKSEDVQRLCEEKLYRRSVLESVRSEAVSGSMKIIDYDVEWAAEHRSEIISRWSELLNVHAVTR